MGHYYHTLINLILFVLSPTYFHFIKGLTQGILQSKYSVELYMILFNSYSLDKLLFETHIRSKIYKLTLLLRSY